MPISGVERGPWGPLTAQASGDGTDTSAELDRQRERRQRRDAAQTDEPLDDVDVRRPTGKLADRLVERVPPLLRVQHPPVTLIEHDRERTVLEPLPTKPAIVRARPRSPVIHQPVPKQQLREPVPDKHQITAGVLACAHEITRALLLRRRHTYQGDLAEPQQPRQPLSRLPPCSTGMLSTGRSGRSASSFTRLPPKDMAAPTFASVQDECATILAQARGQADRHRKRLQFHGQPGINPRARSPA